MIAVLSMSQRHIVFSWTLTLLILLAVLLTQLEMSILGVSAFLVYLAARRQEPHRIGRMERAATRQSTICLTVGMQVLLYPENTHITCYIRIITSSTQSALKSLLICYILFTSIFFFFHFVCDVCKTIRDTIKIYEINFKDNIFCNCIS